MRSKLILKLSSEDTEILNSFSRAVGRSSEDVARHFIFSNINRLINQAAEEQEKLNGNVHVPNGGQLNGTHNAVSPVIAGDSADARISTDAVLDTLSNS